MKTAQEKSEYTPPKLEQHGIFSTVTGVSIPIGFGANGTGDFLDLNGSDLMEGANQ
jgi:hypothetical protein